MICGGEAVVACYCEEHRHQRMKKLRDQKGERYKPQTCGNCGEPGHNRRSCTKAPRPPVERVRAATDPETGTPQVHPDSMRDVLRRIGVDTAEGSAAPSPPDSEKPADDAVVE
jgi:hypothetical protein